MGGFSVLVVVATMGVTYGWQPEGDGPSPEKTERGRVVAQADHIRVSQPRLPSDSHRAMKPESGFDLPSLSPEASDRLAQGTRLAQAAGNSAANRTADAMRNGINGMLRGGANANETGERSAMANATDPMNRQPPSFTGNQPPASATLPSTGSTSRDNTWFDMKTGQRQTPSTTGASSTTNMRQPEQMGPPDLRQRNAQVDPRTQVDANSLPDALRAQLAAAREQEQESSRRRQGLGSTPGFAQPPSGINIPRTNAGQNTGLTLDNLRSTSGQNVGRNDRPSTSDLYNELARANSQNRQSPFAIPSTDQANINQNGGQQANLGLPDRGANANLTSGGSMAMGNLGTNPFNRGNQNTGGLNSDGMNVPATNGNTPTIEDMIAARIRNGEVDPRLSYTAIAKLPVNAYSIDGYGNPIDRSKRVLDEYGRVVSQQRAYELTIGRNNPAINPAINPGGSTVYIPNSPPPTNIAQNGDVRRIPSTSDVPTYQPPNYQASNYSPGFSRPNTNNPANNISNTDRAEVGYRGDTTSKRPVAAQPFFNVFLLISIVGNIFLGLLLNNLRYRFRDLVASKRMVSTSDMSV